MVPSNIHTMLHPDSGLESIQSNETGLGLTYDGLRKANLKLQGHDAKSSIVSQRVFKAEKYSMGLNSNDPDNGSYRTVDLEDLPTKKELLAQLTQIKTKPARVAPSKSEQVDSSLELHSEYRNYPIWSDRSREIESVLKSLVSEHNIPDIRLLLYLPIGSRIGLIDSFISPALPELHRIVDSVTSLASNPAEPLPLQQVIARIHSSSKHDSGLESRWFELKKEECSKLDIDTSLNYLANSSECSSIAAIAGSNPSSAPVAAAAALLGSMSSGTLAMASIAEDVNGTATTFQSQKVRAVLKAITLDGRPHIRPLCSLMDVTLAVQELYELRNFQSGCVSFPNTLKGPYVRESEFFYRYCYKRQQMPDWQIIRWAVPTQYHIAAPYVCPVLCPEMFVASHVEPSDIHHDLAELCRNITETIISQTLGDKMCTELVFDVEISRPIGSEEFKIKSSSIPSIASKAIRISAQRGHTTVHKNEKLYFRLMHIVSARFEPRFAKYRRNAISSIGNFQQAFLRMFHFEFRTAVLKKLDQAGLNLHSIPEESQDRQSGRRVGLLEPSQANIARKAKTRDTMSSVATTSSILSQLDDGDDISKTASSLSTFITDIAKRMALEYLHGIDYENHSDEDIADGPEESEDDCDEDSMDNGETLDSEIGVDNNDVKSEFKIAVHEELVSRRKSSVARTSTTVGIIADRRKSGAGLARKMVDFTFRKKQPRIREASAVVELALGDRTIDSGLDLPMSERWSRAMKALSHTPNDGAPAANGISKEATKLIVTPSSFSSSSSDPPTKKTTTIVNSSKDQSGKLIHVSYSEEEKSRISDSNEALIPEKSSERTKCEDQMPSDNIVVGRLGKSVNPNRDMEVAGRHGTQISSRIDPELIDLGLLTADGSSAVDNLAATMKATAASATEFDSLNPRRYYIREVPIEHKAEVLESTERTLQSDWTRIAMRNLLRPANHEELNVMHQLEDMELEVASMGIMKHLDFFFHEETNLEEKKLGVIRDPSQISPPAGSYHEQGHDSESVGVLHTDEEHRRKLLEIRNTQHKENIDHESWAILGRMVGSMKAKVAAVVRKKLCQQYLRDKMSSQAIPEALESGSVGDYVNFQDISQLHEDEDIEKAVGNLIRGKLQNNQSRLLSFAIPPDAVTDHVFNFAEFASGNWNSSMDSLPATSIAVKPLSGPTEFDTLNAVESKSELPNDPSVAVGQIAATSKQPTTELETGIPLASGHQWHNSNSNLHNNLRSVDIPLKYSKKIVNLNVVQLEVEIAEMGRRMSHELSQLSFDNPFDGAASSASSRASTRTGVRRSLAPHAELQEVKGGKLWGQFLCSADQSLELTTSEISTIANETIDEMQQIYKSSNPESENTFLLTPQPPLRTDEGNKLDLPVVCLEKTIKDHIIGNAVPDSYVSVTSDQATRDGNSGDDVDTYSTYSRDIVNSYLIIGDSKLLLSPESNTKAGVQSAKIKLKLATVGTKVLLQPKLGPNKVEPELRPSPHSSTVSNFSPLQTGLFHKSEHTVYLPSVKPILVEPVGIVPSSPLGRNVDNSRQSLLGEGSQLNVAPKPFAPRAPERTNSTSPRSARRRVTTPPNILTTATPESKVFNDPRLVLEKDEPMSYSVDNLVVTSNRIVMPIPRSPPEPSNLAESFPASYHGDSSQIDGSSEQSNVVEHDTQIFFELSVVSSPIKSPKPIRPNQPVSQRASTSGVFTSHRSRHANSFATAKQVEPSRAKSSFTNRDSSIVYDSPSQSMKSSVLTTGSPFWSVSSVLDIQKESNQLESSNLNGISGSKVIVQQPRVPSPRLIPAEFYLEKPFASHRAATVKEVARGNAAETTVVINELNAKIVDTSCLQSDNDLGSVSISNSVYNEMGLSYDQYHTISVESALFDHFPSMHESPKSPTTAPILPSFTAKALLPPQFASYKISGIKKSKETDKSVGVGRNPAFLSSSSSRMDSVKQKKLSVINPIDSDMGLLAVAIGRRKDALKKES